MDALQADVVVPGRVELRARRDQPAHQLVGEAVDIADEVADELRRGVVVDVVRGADLLDDALVEHRDPVGQRQRLLLVVGDVDARDAEVLLHLLELLAQLHAQLGVEVGKRLVEADDGRLRHQRAGDGDALLLTAGELGDGLLELLVGEVHLLRDRADLRVDLRLFHLLDLQAEGDVVIDRHRREQGVALEDDADVAVLDGDMGDVLAADDDAALGGLDEAGERPERRGLAAAGGAEEGKELPLLHVDVDVVQGGEIAEFHHDVVQTDHV